MVARRTHTSRRRRRGLAATACVLWLLGVEVLPGLHLAFHADDHTHAADGTIVRRGGERGHAHGGPAHGGHAHGGHGHGDHDHHDHDHAGHAPAPPAMLAAEPPAEDPALAADDPLAGLGGLAAAAAAAPDPDDDPDDGGPGHGRDRRHRDEPALDPPAEGHAAAGIAHHAVALHRPPPPLLEPLPVRRAAWRVDDVREHQHPSAFHARPTARGPPAAA